MRNTARWVRVITLASTVTMLAMPVLAAAQDLAARPAPTDDRFCLYSGRTTDTPEIGPLPCDTSRPYMIGHSDLGRHQIPEDSNEQSDGASASPSSPDTRTNPHQLPDVEAP